MVREFTESEQHEIIAALERAGATSACSRCGHPELTLLPCPSIHFYVPTNFHSDPALVTIGVICRKCGCISNHALEALGINISLEAPPQPDTV